MKFFSSHSFDFAVLVLLFVVFAAADGDADSASAPTLVLTAQSSPSSGFEITRPAGQTLNLNISTDFLSVTTTSTPTYTATPSKIFTTSISVEDIYGGSQTSLPSLPTTNGTSNNPLPIQPRITVAYGFAGVLLLLSGIAYTIIGIKIKPFYIFLASSYLVAVGIIVLILYVIRPPVSDAVQGAYLIAVAIPALAAGGISLIFKDVTEGLCCGFGGFTIAMWLLVLKPSGLVESTGGRAAIIAVFTLACFSLSFSHYTRTHGSIACIAFGGATVSILGIDFLSRAGLKEFWVYIWDLNDELFPLNTDSYPVTRGMKVEIACTIILFFAGIISQMKLWRIVKARRDRRKEEQDRNDEDWEHLEIKRGRQVEDAKTRDVLEWERFYNGKVGAKSRASSLHDSSYDSTFESNYSDYNLAAEKDAPAYIKEVNCCSVESIEMANMTRSATKSRSSLLTNEGQRESKTRFSVAPDERRSDRLRANSTKSRKSQKAIPPKFNRSASSRMSTHDQFVTRDSIPHDTRQSSRDPGVVPPGLADEKVHDSLDSRPQATAGDREDEVSGMTGHTSRTQHFSETPHARVTKRSMEDNERMQNPMKKGLEVFQGTHSRTSSVAATIDELTDDEISLPADWRSSTPVPELLENSVNEPRRNEKADSAPEEPQTLVASLPPPPYVILPEKITEQEEPTGSEMEEQNDNGTRESAVRAVRRSSISSSNKMESRSIDSIGNLTQLDRSNIPDNTSSVAVAHRTNEWTRHLDAAEKDALDQFGFPPSLELHEKEVPIEIAAPVEIKELTRTATSSLRPRGHSGQNFSSGRISSKGSIHRQGANPVQRTMSNPMLMQEQSSDAQRTRRIITTGTRTGNLARSVSQPAASDQAKFGNDATVISQILAESPTEDPQTAHLRVLQRVPSVSHMDAQVGRTGEWPSGSNMDIEDDGDNVSLAARRAQLTSEDNMTLAQRQFSIRRATLHQQQQRQQFPWQAQQMLQTNSTPQQQTVWPGLNQQSFLHDSHQPKRGTGIDQHKQQALHAYWRGELQNDIDPFEAQLQASVGKQSSFLTDRRQGQLQAMQLEWEKQARDSVMTTQMRTGHGQDFHKEAMKRMQSVANGRAQ